MNKPEICTWVPIKKSSWRTDCNNSIDGYMFIRHGGMSFCCFCGKKLEVEQKIEMKGKENG